MTKEENEMLNKIRENNQIAMAILKCAADVTEGGFDPCEMDVAGLFKAALSYAEAVDDMVESMSD